jgi:hypothetical protein
MVEDTSAKEERAARTAKEAQDEFYKEFGYALSRWQWVEQALCEIFCEISTCRDRTVASAIFYVHQDFSDRVAMAHSAARFFLTDTNQLEAWGKLRKRFKDVAEIRNALAHYASIIVVPRGPGETHVMLAPSHFDPNSKFKEPRKKTKENIDIRAVRRARASFNALWTDSQEFLSNIRPQLGPPE